MKTLKARLGSQDGAAAVEFAFVLPLLILLVFGMADFARGFNAKITLSGAAREGVRVLALNSGDATNATLCAAPSLDTDGDGCADGVTVNPTACPDSGGDARVEAVYDFQLVTPLSAFMAMYGGTGPDATIPLTGIGVMRCGG